MQTSGHNPCLFAIERNLVSNKHQELANFIWSVADLLRGDYKQSEYGRVILPLTVLRRLDCVLEPTKDAVLARHRQLKDLGVQNMDPVLRKTAGLSFYNTSEMSFRKLLGDQDHVALNLRAYIGGFSPGAVDVLEKYGFDTQISRLAEAGLLYQVVAKFADIDLHPDVVSNHQMGYVFEELIRRFSEISNETAGEHFTPREVIKLMVNLLLAPDEDDLVTPGIVRKVYDPACGTGGMLSEAQDHIQEHNPHATVEVYGQELNGETYAICRSDMMLKGGDPTKIAYGNSFSQDGHEDERFDYMLANPPFGVEWKKVENYIKAEHARGHAGRFGAGLPRINDGSLLFLQHMISKMKRPEDGGSRLAIVFNGSPLFTGAAGSGSRRSAAGSWRTTFWRASSRCPTSSSTTPASPRTSGSSPTARTRPAGARSCCSTAVTTGPRCARASATSARCSPTSTSPS